MNKLEVRNNFYKVNLRSANNSSRIIEGYALKWGIVSRDLGGFVEIISSDSLKNADMTDVVALFNHDHNLILARNVSKTLTLKIDKIGLFYSFEAPKTRVGNDLLVSIRRGDIFGSSFAFICESDRWEEKAGQITRTITAFKKIIDVSPVTNPAYLDTTVAARNLQQLMPGIPGKGYQPDQLTAEILRFS